MAKAVAVAMGLIFLLLGAVGFIRPGFEGMHLSLAHNLSYVVSGTVSLYFGLARSVTVCRLFGFVFGGGYTLLGLLGLLFGTPAQSAVEGTSADARLLILIPTSLELGTSDHIFHLVIGLVFLIGAVITVVRRPMARRAT